MADTRQVFAEDVSSSTPPTAALFFHLSKTNIQRIDSLTSRGSHEAPLNPYQCRGMSSKLVTTIGNVEALVSLWDKNSCNPFSVAALEILYLTSERAKELVESCCSVDWCLASTFQIQNEEAFKEILLEASLCYSTIYDLTKGVSGRKCSMIEDLRHTSTFESPTAAEVMHDRMALLQRFENFLENPSLSGSLIQMQRLAKHLMGRLGCVFASRSITKSLDLSVWPDDNHLDDGWGKNSEFLGGNVCKTTWLGVPCAKKVFNEGVQEEDVLAEAKILAALNHPNIVKFICWGHDTWCHFIAMEQMERGLHSVIRMRAQFKKGAPFPLFSALDIMLQIAYGTCYLHDNGVAHRDLKTSNVVVRQIRTPHLQDYLQVKLVDFGLSKAKLTASRSDTISSPKIGTTAYMPPEAFQPGRANWFKADVYSFGIMCSVILSGKEPFLGIQRGKVCEAICRGERPALPPGTPQELLSLIHESWDSDRNVRPDFVDICARLATLRDKLLREEPLVHGPTDEANSFSSPYVQCMIKKQPDAFKQECCHVQSKLLEHNVEDDEWLVLEQANNDITLKQREEPRMSSSCSILKEQIPQLDLMDWSSSSVSHAMLSSHSRMQASESPELTSPSSQTFAAANYDKNKVLPSSIQSRVVPPTIQTQAMAPRICGFNVLHLLHPRVHTTVFFVPQCCTTSCEVRIKNHLYNISGVDDVIVDYYNQKVTVTGNVSEDKILRELKKVKKRAKLYVPLQAHQQADI